MNSIQSKNGFLFNFVGPDLSQGLRPAYFYFALSAKDSLYISPYNQPVTFLDSKEIRIFSVTLPQHEEEKSPEDAVARWALSFEEGEDILTPFLEKCAEAIYELSEKNLISLKQTALGGLSRGGLIACHIAARIQEIPFILAHAPITFLSYCKEFRNSKSLEKAKELDLVHLKEKLYRKTIRFYIGNRDERVGTKNCFDFINALVEEAFLNRIRSCPIELIIGTSRGYMGHGTASEIFYAGAQWIKGCLHNGT